jgi:hypothetical protein
MSARDKFKKSLDALGVDPRNGFSLGDSDVVYGLRYKNLVGKTIEFSVAHKNRSMLEDELMALPVMLVPYVGSEKSLDGVEWSEGKQCAAHYKFTDWFKLQALVTPGVWFYLGMPEEYEVARRTYEELNPLRRILGAGE